MSTIETPIGNVAASSIDDWESVLHYMQPIMDLYTQEGVTDILIHAYNDIKVVKGSQLIRVSNAFASEIDLVTFIGQVANALGQNVGDDHPILEARFPDTSRLQCTLSKVSPRGATVTIRLPPKEVLSFGKLIEYGALTVDMVDFIREHIEQEDNFLVSGNTGSGKTSFLRACAEFVNPDAVLITAEDTQELYLRQMLPNSVALESPRRRVKDGVKAIELVDLIHAMLRMNPDYCWVGEIREAKAASAWVQIGNTGHTLTASTLHSNGPHDTVKRLQYLLSSSGMLSYDLAGFQVLGNTKMFIHAARNLRKYGRKITDICLSNGAELEPVFVYNESLGRHEYVGRKFF
ncbi:ATPase, T2SS/T4P/T4SS family [Stutzerimonas kunmingensis]|uniref:ATPase, T2SS/T4P/T4SS family n=1 Tax=Stutzerimonas kunmingensis TaxID=1211807 RepID=UPI0028A9D7A5|nr:ATPase, T2SS/T4P/T4SS family [Stutzerimonas kunmingensis]